MASNKEHFNVVFIGHVDHGKSTTVGRLLFDAGTVDEQEMRKLKEKAIEAGKAGFEFAYVMDNLKEERERGVTIDLSHKKFESDKYEFTIIDAPGHADFIKNMITGVSQADAAVLVVAATDGVNEQTKEHAYLSKVFGIDQLVVAVNKMDMRKYDQARFEEVKNDINALVGKLGFKSVKFVPIASLPGDNVVKKSENMAWWTGGTLLDHLNQFEIAEKPTTLPLRVPLQDVYNIKGIGLVPVGRVETGILRPNSKCVIVPGKNGTGMAGEVKDVEMHHEKVAQALPGFNVGFSVKGYNKGDIAKGDVLGTPQDPPSLASEFTGQVFVLNHPSVITVGYSPVFHVHTAQVSCRITELVKKVAPDQQDNPDFIRNGDAAIVKFVPLKPVVIEKRDVIPHLARFAIRDSGKTVAAGQCIDVVKKELKF
ncbi:translation elongation factor EF-1 subunit alpha [Candidatus Woesearchaeota archaeon]|nr:translation elongation factor EF-1 subunit alpha [Candidatus Woesearchaeota archaeon]USN43770.1 MAG: translation elongation factor EF-1 subunit alpha [Candidatus Woesearchaeota archaeon]